MWNANGIPVTDVRRVADIPRYAKALRDSLRDWLRDSPTAATRQRRQLANGGDVPKAATCQRRRRAKGDDVPFCPTRGPLPRRLAANNNDLDL